MPSPLQELLALGAAPVAPKAESVAASRGTELERLFVADLEMSGPNPQVHEVLDIGWVIASAAGAIDEISSWSSRIRPLRIGNAELGALKVVRYTPKAWRDAIDADVAIRRMAEEATGAAFAGWGLSHDLAFVAEAFRRLDVPWPFAPVAIDVQVIARKLLARGETVDRFNLGHVADRLGIGRMGEHGALADAYATYDVLVELARLHASDLSRPA